MGRYFGREPRYSKEEAEAQAKQAIEAAVSKGRPPDEDWRALAGRMSDIDRELATRPRVDVIPPPPPRRAEPADGSTGTPGGGRRPVHQILRPATERAPEPPAPPPAQSAAPTPRATRASAPVAAAPAKGTKRAAGAAPAKRSTKAPASGRTAKQTTRSAGAAAPKAPATKRAAAAKKRPGS